MPSSPRKSAAARTVTRPAARTAAQTAAPDRRQACLPPKIGEPPRRRQTLAELRDLQRLAAEIIMHPLSEEFEMRRTWSDGQTMEAVVGGFIRPNDRLTAAERLEIYNKQYWFRLIDCLYDDFPGLVAVLGRERFSTMARIYVLLFPSRSFTLRNLGSRMAEFIEGEPAWGGRWQRLAVDMARFEWAQVVAFDGPARPVLTAADFQAGDPNELKLALQPYITLLDLAYPLDHFALALRGSNLRGEASNAVDETARPAREKSKRLRRPRPKRTFLAVHRLNNDLYFKRLDPAAYRILVALREGHCLGDAAARACGKTAGATPQQVTEWFANWTVLGWFCK